MNILDIKDSDIDIPDTPEELFNGIFKRQTELHHKYQGIELANGIGLGIVKDIPFNIDNPKWQYVIKDYAWRVTEELTEALEAKEEGNQHHTVEEIIDALHFYTELLIICKLRPDISTVTYSLSSILDILDPVYHLGLACNLLKNKPWKNTHVATDKFRFELYIVQGYCDLLSVASYHGLTTLKEIYAVYMKKSLVNKFRIRSNY